MRVARAANQAEAELLQGLLLEAGVPSLARRAGGFDVPDFLAAGPRDVLVPEGGAAVAREVLGRARAARRRRPARARRGCVRSRSSLASLVVAVVAAGVVAASPARRRSLETSAPADAARRAGAASPAAASAAPRRRSPRARCRVPPVVEPERDERAAQAGEERRSRSSR